MVHFFASRKFSNVGRFQTYLEIAGENYWRQLSVRCTSHVLWSGLKSVLLLLGKHLYEYDCVLYWTTNILIICFNKHCEIMEIATPNCASITYTSTIGSGALKAIFSTTGFITSLADINSSFGKVSIQDSGFQCITYDGAFLCIFLWTNTWLQTIEGQPHAVWNL